jgi:hypothetical protein
MFLTTIFQKNIITNDFFWSKQNFHLHEFNSLFVRSNFNLEEFLIQSIVFKKKYTKQKNLKILIS